jgi:hypothetical protein
VLYAWAPTSPDIRTLVVGLGNRTSRLARSANYRDLIAVYGGGGSDDVVDELPTLIGDCVAGAEE